MPVFAALLSILQRALKDCQSKNDDLEIACEKLRELNRELSEWKAEQKAYSVVFYTHGDDMDSPIRPAAVFSNRADALIWRDKQIFSQPTTVLIVEGRLIWMEDSDGSRRVGSVNQERER